MMWVFAIIIVLVLGGVALVASGVGAAMPEAHVDRRDVLVPGDGPLGPEDLRAVRFNVTLRGYRMAEVDALLGRLAAELEERAPVQPGERDQSQEPVQPEQPEQPVQPEQED